jgi:hypothetical protein
MIEAVRRNDPVRCPVCPRTVERRSRQQVYCSTRCRKRAGRGKSRADALKIPPRYPHSGHGTNPHKSASENNVLPRPKSQSSLFCKGPLNLLGGGSWKWPGTGHLDGKTLAKIRHSEIGAELLMPPKGGAPTVGTGIAPKRQRVGRNPNRDSGP